MRALRRSSRVAGAVPVPSDLSDVSGVPVASAGPADSLMPGRLTGERGPGTLPGTKEFGDSAHAGPA